MGIAARIGPGAAVRVLLVDGTLITGTLVDIVKTVGEHNAAVTNREGDHSRAAMPAPDERFAFSDIVLVNRTGNRYTVAAETIRELKITPRKDPTP